MIEVRPLDVDSAADRAAYKRLNIEYLVGYAHPAGEIPHLLEPQDLVVLDHPRENVIAKGGMIWIAESPLGLRRVAVGAVAVVPEVGAEWELATVVVAPSAQRRGLGRRLVELALRYARERSAEKIVLDTNSKLVAAINLYASLGFVRLPEPRGKFETADVAMELALTSHR